MEKEKRNKGEENVLVGRKKEKGKGGKMKRLKSEDKESFPMTKGMRD